MALVTSCLSSGLGCRTPLNLPPCGCADAGGDSLAAAAEVQPSEPRLDADGAGLGAEVARDLPRDRPRDRAARLVPAKLPEYCTPDGWCGADLAFSAMWGAAADDVWLAARGLGNQPTASVLLHFDGDDWTAFAEFAKALDSDLATDLEALWGTGPSDIWTGGTEGRVFHWDGTTWTRFCCLGLYTIHGLGGSAGDDVWAIADSGMINHWNGVEWKHVQSPTRSGRARHHDGHRGGDLGGQPWALGARRSRDRRPAEHDGDRPLGRPRVA